VARLSFFLAALLACPAIAGAAPQQQGKLKEREPARQDRGQAKEQEPPEEDEGLKEKEYTFNPLQATRELQTGAFYAKKGNWRAAARRYREATRWNPSYTEAFLRLGQAEEKLGNTKESHEAFAKYLELAPDAKDAAAIRKKLARHAS
jgi:tetratricopeptide (TPR) repeat protein